MRCFLAVDILDDLKKDIERFQQGIKHLNLKIVARDNLHVTLKFLGDVDEKEIMSKLKGMETKPFQSKTTGIGFFPTSNFVRVVWLGLEDNGFSDIVREIEKKLSLPKDSRFTPHITIARARKPLKNLRMSFNPDKTVEVSKTTLYSSKLTPKGPIYEKIDEF